MLGKTLERIQKLRNKNAMWKQSHKGNTFFNAEKQLEDRPLKNVPAKILFRNIVDVVTAEERLNGDHDCKLSPDSTCNGCQVRE